MGQTGKTGIAEAPQAVFASRQELLQNEYKKVIENHPQTLILNSSTQNYDDTEF